MREKIQHLAAFAFAGLQHTDIREIDDKAIENITDDSERADFNHQVAPLFMTGFRKYAFLPEQDTLKQRRPAAAVF